MLGLLQRLLVAFLAFVCFVSISAFELDNVQLTHSDLNLNGTAQEELRVRRATVPYTTSLGFYTDDILRDEKFSTGQIAYTSVIDYTVDVDSWTDEQLLGVAEQAWDEMIVVHQEWMDDCKTQGRKDFLKRFTPPMVSVLAVGNTLYIGSVMKLSTPNALFTFKPADDGKYVDKKVIDIMENAFVQAATEFTNKNKDWAISKDPRKGHTNSGCCAEFVATSLCVIDTALLPWDVKTKKKPRIVAWGTGASDPFTVAGTQQNPCWKKNSQQTKDGTDKIGCGQFVEGKMASHTFHNCH
ncbi:hypothetical protein C7974DRAFT_377404 [Boeremia exigua]|uniref:uncharacterized protein n=1 Tax=Boeremia exigua TaxID=749465 RepID=UPI001E8C9F8F|nr:uncharacterized protein C7974DRAFT_377404 [Boeremia exigua]KAH6621725.1 hypothetical protein C7974DRAFT_377404 [Boeremia exigua]